MTITKHVLILLLLCGVIDRSIGDETLKLQKVTEGVYAIFGELGNRSTANRGNNATFGLVITSAGAVLIDSGGSYKGAQDIAALIKTVTDTPVKIVINTGGQDHRWLGNDYFKAQGARLIANAKAVQDQKARYQAQRTRLSNLMGEAALSGTKPVYAEETFDTTMQLNYGGVLFEIIHTGSAHTLGDSFVWLPQTGVMFTGDIVYTQCLLSIGKQFNSKSWLSVYRSMAAYKPKHVVPGHGEATDLHRANADTYAYLMFLRNAIATLIDGGGDMAELNTIDQSQFNYLLNYQALARRNAQQMFAEMEWE